jgi:hypothetical protein
MYDLAHPRLLLRLVPLAAVVAASFTGCGQHGSRRGLPPPDAIVLAAPVSVPMDSAGGRPVVSVRINDHGPYRLILDSGAAGSVFSDRLAQELGFPRLGHADMTRPGSPDKEPATLTRIGRIEIDGLRLEGVSAVYADLSQLQQRLATDIAGVLSATMLDGLLVTYDYPAHRIGFRQGGLPAADGRTVFNWPEGERLPSVPMEIGGRTVQIDIDTGSGGGFTVTQTTTAGLTWLEAPVAAEPIRTLDRATPSATARLQGNIRIGQYTFTNPVIRTNDGVLQMIGYEVLKDFVLTLDAKNHRFELRKE